ncbi:hypothetical protein JAAARDRAFT_31975 [Jaapia argillacea MUCL 33604]|uniref:Mediator complex subunit 16 n=1 Tax=Jaapia argillacea MUCL 33604 TaxID=933084 RepID=A0A067QEG2_9AGAM|nr:hypothetical protein JAAARDRAFT_31975 [Jaapia argillacea MUCL 33604]
MYTTTSPGNVRGSNYLASTSPMLSHEKLTSSPWKGKVKDGVNWSLGWWDVFQLAERTETPPVWSSSSTVFTPHATQPLVIGRLFPSSQQFLMPSPSLIASSPTSYERPSLISLAPNDQWLYAYFPGRDGDGVGCLWRRGNQVDAWNIREWWGFARGAGVVAATWAGAHREWIPSSTGSAFRLPTVGPSTPVTDPTLVLVTQNHQISICYIRSYIPSLKVLACSLLQPSTMMDSEPSHIPDLHNGPGGSKVCIAAAIGLTYNDPTILVAMRSQLVPSPPSNPPYSAMDLSLSLEIPQQLPASQESLAIEWETWGELSTIELCEVHLDFDGLHLGLSTNPLPPILNSAHRLTNLTFIAAPSPSIFSSTPPSPPPEQGSPKRVKVEHADIQEQEERGSLYLAASYLDFGDFSTLPKSELALYELSRNTTLPNSSHPSWSHQHLGSHSFAPNILAFLCPLPPSPDGAGLLAGLFRPSGTVPKEKLCRKEAPVGDLVLLKFPDLSVDQTWEGSPILCPLDQLGNYLPHNAILSSNYALICTASSSERPLSIHPFPRPSPPGDFLAPSRPPTSHLTTALLSAIHSRTTPSDVIYHLSLPTTPLRLVEETLYEALTSFDSGDNGLPGMWIHELLGVAVETYRTRSQAVKDSSEKEDLNARWQIAHDACSVVACNSAFDDCREGDGYDLEAVWQLIGLCRWSVDFVEKLMKACILVEDSPLIDLLKSDDSEDLFGSTPPSPVSGHPQRPPPLIPAALLHLIHPYTLHNLQKLLSHVKRFRAFLNSLSASGENAHIARNLLLDMFACAGVDVTILEDVLSETAEFPIFSDTEQLRRALVSCQPLPTLGTPLQKLIHRIVISDAIDRPKLFIKPTELIDSLASLSMANQPTKEKDTDVVSKEDLLHGLGLNCLRCKGRCQIGTTLKVGGRVSEKWLGWERIWKVGCICGGLWSNV